MFRHIVYHNLARAERRGTTLSAHRIILVPLIGHLLNLGEGRLVDAIYYYWERFLRLQSVRLF